MEAWADPLDQAAQRPSSSTTNDLPDPILFRRILVDDMVPTHEETVTSLLFLPATQPIPLLHIQTTILDSRRFFKASPRVERGIE